MRTVLFVCTGNASRSQMAEAFFNSLTKNASAMSAGTKPASKVDELTIEVMKEVGVDISLNRPKLLVEEYVKKADIVVSMCEYECPDVGKPSMHWEIEDTKGKSIEKIRAIRDMIRDRVIDLASKF